MNGNLDGSIAAGKAVATNSILNTLWEKSDSFERHVAEGLQTRDKNADTRRTSDLTSAYEGLHTRDKNAEGLHTRNRNADTRITPDINADTRSTSDLTSAHEGLQEYRRPSHRR